MADVRPIGRSASAAGFVLGRQLDSIPFSAYHLLIIAVLALVGFIEGYDLVMTGSLLVLAKEPLNLTGPDIRWRERSLPGGVVLDRRSIRRRGD